MEAHQQYQPEEVVTPRHFLQQIIMQESLSTIRVLALKTRRMGTINWRSSILPMVAIFEDLMNGKINWRSHILPMVAISQDQTNGKIN